MFGTSPQWMEKTFRNRWSTLPATTRTKNTLFMVENHGGLILNYGDRFSAEMQLYASSGYIVLYSNPLFNNYPGEAKRLCHDLKLRKIETVSVEIPGSGHGTAKRPSNLIAKIAHTIARLDKYRTDKK